MSKKASAIEVERQRAETLHKLKRSYLGCRDMRHAWNRSSARYRAVDGGVVERQLVCRECGMQKWEWFVQRTGERDGTAQYRPPEGYYTRGLGRFSPVDIRREEFRRMGRFSKNGG